MLLTFAKFITPVYRSSNFQKTLQLSILWPHRDLENKKIT